MDMQIEETTFLVGFFYLSLWPERLCSIVTGFANKPKADSYETISYSSGPGFELHRSKDLNQTWIKVDLISEEERSKPTYQNLASTNLSDAAHAGDDVVVYATGKGSNLVQGVFEQNYIAYVISYANCIGPAADLNPKCTQTSVSSNSRVTTQLTLTVVFLMQIVINLIM